MQQTIIHVGPDVDDTQCHGSAFNKDTGAVINFRCRPTLKGLLSQLEKLGKHFPGYAISLCYEASYIGHTLQRDLAENCYHCDVVVAYTNRNFKPAFWASRKVAKRSRGDQSCMQSAFRNEGFSGCEKGVPGPYFIPQNPNID